MLMWGQPPPAVQPPQGDFLAQVGSDVGCVLVAQVAVFFQTLGDDPFRRDTRPW
jgi:hypothetical protein